MPETIDRLTLQRWLEQGRSVTIVDVQPADAFAEWHIPGSIHVDKYQALKDGDKHALAGVELPRGAPVVTVCPRGNTSRLAAAQLRARGYDASSFSGGLQAWSLAWNTAEIPLPGSEATVLQVRRTGKGCLSYVVAAKGDAAVIDPSVETDVYLDLLSKRSWRLTSVLETHVQADHLSRARALAEATGAGLHLPAQDRVSFAFQPLQEGSTHKVGGAMLRTLFTPGHTPESCSYLLDEKALFTGDTLFLAGVGRPDLEADSGAARGRAHLLYRSIQRLIELADDTLILPAHTDGPVAFDGKPLVATLAEVRRRLNVLQLDESAFVDWILERLPPTPANFERIVRLNEQGELPGEVIELEAGANRCAVG